MNPLISIIVPVYNAESTLNRCVDSVVNQKFTDWELLLVDDGSSDFSGNICDEYVSRNNRIRVFHKDNQGVSSARNLGLRNAVGQWILFLDSDDYFLDDALNLNYLYEISEDLIVFSYNILKDGNQTSFILKDSVINDNNELEKFIENRLQNKILKVPWGKLFKRSLLQDLSFDEKIKVGEDFLFVLNYLFKIRSCRLISKSLYVYTEFENNFFIKYKLDINSAIYIMKELYCAYLKLGVKSVDFERWLFYDYKRLCQDYIYIHPTTWYKNQDVMDIYNNIKSSLGFVYNVKYRLLRFTIVTKMSFMFRSFCRFLKKH